MENFVYKSVTVLPSRKIRFKYTKDPNVAEKLGGVLTCRSSSTVHPILTFIPNLSAPNFKKAFKHHLSSLPPKN